MYKSTQRVLSIAVLASAFLSTGCATQERLEEYQAEVLALREERTELKKQNNSLRQQNQSYEVALAEANQTLQTAATETEHPELDALGIDYRTDGGNFVISIPSSITFASGRADLKREGQEALRVVAQTLASDHAGGQYWIEGHTDSDPIRKSKWGSNRELSMARAMAVLHFLVEKCAVPDEKCVVAGHGEYEPVAGGTDDTAKAQNRRVEIVVHG